MSNPSFFFIANLISFLLMMNTNYAAGDTDQYSTCSSNSTTCGNDILIRYPFWVAKETTATNNKYCGYPEFKLTCSQNGQPILTLPTNSYYVTEINYESDTLTLVDIDVVNQSCPRARNNVSLASYPLSYNELDLNLTFYFNCSTNVSYYLPDSIGCFVKSISRKESYVFVKGNETKGYDWSTECEEMVEVVVKEIEISDENSGGLVSEFGKAMGKGFVLDWEKARDCVHCEDSGGYCGGGYVDDRSTDEILCFCKDGSVTTSRCKKKVRSKFTIRNKKIIVLTTGLMVGGGVLALIICCRRATKSRIINKEFWKRSQVDQEIETFIRNHGPLALTRYKFSDMKKMTKSFKVKLGQGGYGDVYKGELLNGCHVAVKILTASKGNGQDFINEVASISRTSHVNVVTLLGFCLEGQRKALIYEFMPNGSLDKFIHKNHNNIDESAPSLTLEKFYQIAIGIARGLEYLHKGCNTRIVHFDIKPHNILLDEDFCPKISDFGLAKLCPRKESIISISDARGTIGYLAPEMWNRNFGGISHKSDVYSYGMMLLDIVGERMNTNDEVSSKSEKYFPDWIYSKLEEGCSLGSNRIIPEEEDDIAKRMTVVGLWCIQTFPMHRPTISRVIEMLEGSLDSLEMPPKPVMSSPTRIEAESSTTTATY